MIKNIGLAISFFKGMKYFENNCEFAKIKRNVFFSILLGGRVSVSKEGNQLVIELPLHTAIRVQKSDYELKMTAYKKAKLGGSIEKQKETVYLLCDPINKEVCTKSDTIGNSFAKEELTSVQRTVRSVYRTTGEMISIPVSNDQVAKAKLDSSIVSAYVTTLKTILAPEELEDMIHLGNAEKMDLEIDEITKKLHS